MRDELNHPSDQLLLRSLDREIEAPERVALCAHTSVCARCRQRLRDMETVSAAVRQHAASLEDSPTGQQRAALLAALELTPRERPMQYPWLALAAALLLAGVWGMLSTKPPAPLSPAPKMGTGPFIALPYSDENLTPEGAVVLQVELPPAALLLAGMPVTGNAVDGRVRAEVLVGADGLARGIRFIN